MSGLSPGHLLFLNVPRRLLVTPSLPKSQEESSKTGTMQRRLQRLQLDFQNAEQQSRKAASQEAAERQSHQQALRLLQVMLVLALLTSVSLNTGCDDATALLGSCLSH